MYGAWGVRSWSFFKPNRLTQSLRPCKLYSAWLMILILPSQRERVKHVKISFVDACDRIPNIDPQFVSFYGMYGYPVQEERWDCEREERERRGGKVMIET